MRSRTRMLLLTALVVSLTTLRHHLRGRHLELRLTDWFDSRKRPDVITTTPWLAPIVWEGTFDTQVLEKFYRRQNLTVGLAVFAAGRLAEESLLLFLRLADAHFLAGHRVVFYVLSDRELALQDVRLGPLRELRTLDMGDRHEWPEAQLWRMRSLGEHIAQRIQREVQFLFSATAEQLIQSAVGAEVLGASVARLHAWWYFHGTRNLPYERRPASAAYIPFGQGDFYYDGALVGGTPLRLLDFIEEYLRGAASDFQAGLNSTYERYLNKYFFVHKPSKLLSPEYGWDTTFNPPPQIRYVKVAQQPRRRW
ncbi:putative glycosyltransferase 6 domain-containing protein 1 [Ochotona princeps]|uniref:putative glycosyltransferase 6 domain-containing protein 1 n=1 Tax=Ochotona princeps TaxID=9978 RepID=UPI0027147189|nr:putative glycosyltransferase 6 domain-containing protein 1 [Ochotona princeps]